MENAKKYYQLWWEYLKISDLYDYAMAWWPDQGLPTGQLTPFIYTYLVFGNVFQDSFDQWWEENKHPILEKPPIDVDVRQIHLAARFMEMVFQRTDIDELGKIAQKSQNFRAAFLYHCRSKYEEFEKYNPGSIFIEVQLYDTQGQEPSAKMIATEVAKIISDKKKDPNFKKRAGRQRLAYLTKSASRADLKKLQLFLDVFNLHRKVGDWVKVITDPRFANIVKLDENNFPEDYETRFMRYKRKAKTISENAAFGHFPGRYQQPINDKLPF